MVINYGFISSPLNAACIQRNSFDGLSNLHRSLTDRLLHAHKHGKHTGFKRRLDDLVQKYSEIQNTRRDK